MKKSKTAYLSPEESEAIPLPVEIKRHPRARRISLRIHTVRNTIILTVPKYGSIKEAKAFLQTKIAWIEKQVNCHKFARAEIRPGMQVPILGEQYTLVHAPERRGGAWLEDNMLIVTGDSAFLERRVKDFLKRHAKRVLSDMAYPYAKQLGKHISHISAREMHSRWGSCSSEGRLTFNWRLVLAPESIAAYVVAHEVAHLVHMDHSEAFWETVDSLHLGANSARRWLKQHGQSLFLWG